MRKLIRFLFLIFLTFFVLVFHFSIAYTLPYPYDKINILFIYLILYLLWTKSGGVVWVAFLTHILIEAFPSSAFGVTLLSSSVAFLVSYWLSVYYITNKKWYGATTLMIVTLFTYRVLYSIFLFLAQRFDSSSVHVEWKELWQLGMWEILLTSVVFTILYSLLYKFSQTFHRAILR